MLVRQGGSRIKSGMTTSNRHDARQQAAKSLKPCVDKALINYTTRLPE
jgi:hypothetical protein